MEVFTTYSSAVLKSIGKMSRISANYHLFSLNDIIRNRATALGIRRQKMFTSYRRSRGGSTIHRIRTHIHTLWTKLDKSSTQHRQTNSGVSSNNLIKINIQQTVLKQIPNIISLNVINAQSICGPNGKTEDFIDHITQNHVDIYVDICVVTETFLTEQNNVTQAALHLPSYAFQDQPRSNGAARGGIGIFYCDSFQLSKLSHTERRSFELSEWHVSWHNYCMRLCTVYHQPYSTPHPITDTTFMHEFESYLDETVLVKEMLCITGDFNLHVDDPDDTYGCQFNNLLSSYGLVNHVTFPTHQAGHTLDLVITRNNQELELGSIKPGYFLSDHCFICSDIVIPRPDVQKTKLTYRKLKSIDKPSFASDLESICQDLLQIDDLNVLAVQYNCRLLSLLDKHAPVTSKTLSVHPKVPWFSSNLTTLKRQRRKAEKQWRTNMLDPNSQSKFQATRNKYRYSLSAAKCSFFSDAIIKAEGDQKKLYSIIKSLTAVKSDMPLPHHTSSQQLAEDFGQFFIKKIDNIRSELNAPANLLIPQSSSYTGNHLTKFNQLTHADVRKLVMSSKTTSCDLDPIPTSLLKDHISILTPIITKMINLSLQTGEFPTECKLAFVKPVLKKPGLATTLKNYRPISNLSFISKIAE